LKAALGAHRGCIVALRPPSPVSFDRQTSSRWSAPSGRTASYCILGPQILGRSVSSSGSGNLPRMIAISCWSVIFSNGTSPRSMDCVGLPSSLSATCLMASRSPCSAFSANLSAMMRRRRGTDNIRAQHQNGIILEVSGQPLFRELHAIALDAGKADFEGVALGTHRLDLNCLAGRLRRCNDWLRREVEGNAEDIGIFYVEQLLVEVVRPPSSYLGQPRDRREAHSRRWCRRHPKTSRNGILMAPYRSSTPGIQGASEPAAVAFARVSVTNVRRFVPS
jgi:hypothetical protein